MLSGGSVGTAAQRCAVEVRLSWTTHWCAAVMKLLEHLSFRFVHTITFAYQPQHTPVKHTIYTLPLVIPPNQDKGSMSSSTEHASAEAEVAASLASRDIDAPDAAAAAAAAAATPNTIDVAMTDPPATTNASDAAAMQEAEETQAVERDEYFFGSGIPINWDGSSYRVCHEVTYYKIIHLTAGIISGVNELHDSLFDSLHTRWDDSHNSTRDLLEAIDGTRDIQRRCQKLAELVRQFHMASLGRMRKGEST